MRRRAGGLVWLVVLALVAAFLVHAGADYIGLRVHPLGLVGLCVLAVVTAWLVHTTREPLPALALPSERPGGPSPDRPFERVDRIEDRLSWGGRAEHHFDAGVRPVLARIAEDRLRRRHGVDLARQPEAARHLLGDQLWVLVAPQQAAGPGAAPTTGPRRPPSPTRPPSPAELEALVRRLETI